MEKQELLEYICDWYGITKVPQIILNQIYKFTTERRYSYKDIARALSYYIEVQHNKPEIKYGIAIVPYVMDEAQKWFKQKEKEKEQQRIAAQQHNQQSNSVKQIKCNPIANKTKRKQIDFNNLEDKWKN